MEMLHELINWLNSHSGLFTGIGAIATLVFGICKYNKHIEQQRIQYFIDFGKKYTENEDIRKVVEYLEYLEDGGTIPIDKPTVHQVEMYMRFIEELELMIRSGAVTESAAIYLFGHYTTFIEKVWKAKWRSLEYENCCWSVYRSFVRRVINFKCCLTCKYCECNEKFKCNYKNIKL